MTLTIRDLQDQSHDNSRAHGFWDDAPDGENGGRYDDAAMRVYLGNKLMLVAGEVAEAHEELRRTDLVVGEYHESKGGKPEGIASELADIVIRVADLAEYLGIDLENAIKMKAAYNASRPMRHGKAF